MHVRVLRLHDKDYHTAIRRGSDNPAVHAIQLRDTDQQYILSGEKSSVINPSVFRRRFKKAVKEIPDVRPLSPHCCRHTYVSQLQAMGVSIETIQSLAGHADVDMTKHYLHVQTDVKENAVSQLNSIF